MYGIGVYAPDLQAVMMIKERYSDTQRDYLARFKDSELYRYFSKLEDSTTSSQEAESAMASAIINNIRTVGPQ